MENKDMKKNAPVELNKEEHNMENFKPENKKLPLEIADDTLEAVSGGNVEPERVEPASIGPEKGKLEMGAYESAEPESIIFEN